MKGLVAGRIYFHEEDSGSHIIEFISEEHNRRCTIKVLLVGLDEEDNRIKTYTHFITKYLGNNLEDAQRDYPEYFI